MYDIVEDLYRPQEFSRRVKKARGGYSLVDPTSVNPTSSDGHPRGCLSGITPAPSSAGELETVKISPSRLLEFKSDS